MHEHSSISWFFITQPYVGLTVYPSLIYAAEWHSLHSYPYASHSTVHFGQFQFKSQKSFNDLNGMTGSHYLWIPSASAAAVTLATDVDIFDWANEDYDSLAFSLKSFNWDVVKDTLKDTVYWDCACKSCFAALTAVTPDGLSTPSPPSSDTDDDPWDPDAPLDLTFIDDPSE